MTKSKEPKSKPRRQANKQITVYPDPTDRYIVGGNTPAMHRAIACWAIELKNNMPELDRAEWNFLADVLNSSYDTDLLMEMTVHGSGALALEVHDAQLYSQTGDKWFGNQLDKGSGQEATNRLLEKVQAMTWQQCQYIRTATNFFWSKIGMDRIDYHKDEWWTLPYRVQVLREAEE